MTELGSLDSTNRASMEFRSRAGTSTGGACFGKISLLPVAGKVVRGKELHLGGIPSLLALRGGPVGSISTTHQGKSSGWGQNLKGGHLVIASGRMNERVRSLRALRLGEGGSPQCMRREKERADNNDSSPHFGRERPPFGRVGR